MIAYCPWPRLARIRNWPYPVVSRSCWTMSRAFWQRDWNSSSAGPGSKPMDRRALGIRVSEADVVWCHWSS
jgi:hypothetical protein